MSAIGSIQIQRCDGSKFGTERAEELLSRLGCPDTKLKIIHVAGSNGKGSVCEYLQNILACAGKKVGAFTSPDVFSYEEQFRIDLAPAPRSLIESYLARAARAAEGMADKPSAFETEFCAALAMFAGEGCEYCVLECGLGGLYDATNAVQKKELAVITSITLEHTAVLGATIADICRHKGGIIRGCPTVVPANLCGEALQYFTSRGAIVAGQRLKIIRRARRMQRFECECGKFTIRMRGDEQAYNAAVAAEGARILRLPRGAVRRGLKRASLPGRVEVIKKGGIRYILDGAHNPQAFSPLLQTVDCIGGRKTLIYTCLSDKDVRGCAQLLAGRFSRILIVPAPSPRAMDVLAIAGAFSMHGDVRICADIPSAMRAAQGKTIVACGSFTLLKEVKNWIEKES